MVTPLVGVDNKRGQEGIQQLGRCQEPLNDSSGQTFFFFFLFFCVSDFLPYHNNRWCQALRAESEVVAVVVLSVVVVVVVVALASGAQFACQKRRSEVNCACCCCCWCCCCCCFYCCCCCRCRSRQFVICLLRRTRCLFNLRSSGALHELQQQNTRLERDEESRRKRLEWSGEWMRNSSSQAVPVTKWTTFYQSVCLSVRPVCLPVVTHCCTACRFYYLDILNMMLEAEGELRTHSHNICASTEAGRERGGRKRER